MKYLINPSTLHGSISIPPSKSQTLRALLFAALAKGKSVISNYLISPDTDKMIQACRLFGAKLNVTKERIEVIGVGGKIACAENVIDAGNSGIILRFLAAVGALCNNPVVITGDHSIRYHRDMAPLLDALTQLGVSAKSMRGDGYPPVIITGPLKGGRVEMLGEDSQPISALLIAGSLIGEPIDIHVKNPGEKPWIALTLKWLDFLGVSYENHDFSRLCVRGGHVWEGFDYTVPGDLSSAAFPIAASLITGSSIKVDNLDSEDPQGDKELISVFQKMGANIEVSKNSLSVQQGGKLKGITVDINNFVDAITILAVVGCFADGETIITNAQVARKKECNRLECITKELKKMGADIEETTEGLIVRKSFLRGAKLTSHGDHRMAMSLAVAALGAKGESSVEKTACVVKTFPNFAEHFYQIGANVLEVS